MKEKKHIEITDELLEEIISTAYGDAGFFLKLKIKYLSLKDEIIKRIYLEYKSSARAVHKIKEKEFPESSSSNIFSKIEAERINSLPAKAFSTLFYRPIISIVTTGIIIIVVASLLILNKQPGSIQYSKAEIELAEKQVKESLALVGFAINKTKNILEEEVIQERIGKPVRKGFDTVNKLFSGG